MIRAFLIPEHSISNEFVNNNENGNTYLYIHII